MNCKALRPHFEIPLHSSADLGTSSAEVAQHLATCAECSRFVKSQSELSTGLELLRDSAPQLGSSFDAGVLANYRKLMFEQTSRQPTPSRQSSLRFLGIVYWSVATAVVIFVAALLFYPSHKRDRIRAKSQDAPIAGHSVPTMTGIHPTMLSHDAAVSRASVHTATRRHAAKKLPVIPQQPSNSPAPITSAQKEYPIPAPFRGLMYCDPLSCSGPMQMIRLQLPFFPGDLPLGAAPANGVVYADVVVGSDGIARGIRVLK